MFIEIIRTFCQQKVPVEVYVNANDTTKFKVGYILSWDNNYFLMSLVSPGGMYDGLYLDRIDKVLAIKHNTRYIGKLFKRVTVDASFFPTIINNNDLRLSLLEYTKDGNLMTTIELFGSGNVDGRGFVENIDNNVCYMNEVDDNGDHFGSSAFLIKNITNVACNSEGERKIELLFREKSKNKVIDLSQR